MTSVTTCGKRKFVVVQFSQVIVARLTAASVAQVFPEGEKMKCRCICVGSGTKSHTWGLFWQMIPALFVSDMSCMRCDPGVWSIHRIVQTLPGGATTPNCPKHCLLYSVLTLFWLCRLRHFGIIKMPAREALIWCMEQHKGDNTERSQWLKFCGTKIASPLVTLFWAQ